jgi:hypothetical protein
VGARGDWPVTTTATAVACLQDAGGVPIEGRALAPLGCTNVVCGVEAT